MVIFFVDQNYKYKSLSEILDVQEIDECRIEPIETVQMDFQMNVILSKKYLEYERNKIFCDKWTVIGVGSSTFLNPGDAEAIQSTRDSFNDCQRQGS